MHCSITNQIISRPLLNMTAKLMTIILMITLAWTGQQSFATTTKHVHKSVKTTKAVKATKSSNHHVTKKAKHTSIQKKTNKQIKKASKSSHKKNTKKTIHRSKHIRPTYGAPLADDVPAAVNTTNITESHLPAYLLSSIEKNLVTFVRKTVATIRYTAYKLGGTRIDTSRGIYVVDCSTYVDHILKSVYPRAYTSLTSWSGTEKPTTDDFYHYFTNLSEDSRHWNMIDDVEELRPGDILVFRSKNKYGSETGGHVMIVMDKPTREGNTFLVRIADSASSGHSKDTRTGSGIGIGTMLLKVNPKTFQPYAYAWKVGSRWENNVNFAMARPIDLG